MKQTTVSFKTVGCRLNRAETAQFQAAFESAGYKVTPFGKACDVCVIHTCVVTRQAEKDCLHLARAAKRMQPAPFVVLAGCAAETNGAELCAACGADLTAGQKEKYFLPEILARHGFPSGKPGPKKLPRFETIRAFVKIQDGCDFRCAYCIVPRARGSVRSRPFNEIIEEVAGLAASGYTEFTFSGANMGCYDDGGKKLVDLLERIEVLPGVARMRISSIEISTVEREVIDYMARSSKLCRFLHLPLQSGADEILRRMGRHYTARQYRELVDYALQKMPMLGLGTDALVGFPGEDEKAFAATWQLIHDLPFSNLHVFPYSRRKDTPADEMPDQVPPAEKKKRVRLLLDLKASKRKEFARKWIGKETSVLIEKVTSAGVATGWTGEYLPARVMDKQLKPNMIIRFMADQADGELLAGKTF